jgi:hypothetical protein
VFGGAAGVGAGAAVGGEADEVVVASQKLSRSEQLLP